MTTSFVDSQDIREADGTSQFLVIPAKAGTQLALPRPES